MDAKAQAFDAAASSVASKATQLGAGTAFASWFLSSEFGMLAGIAIGLVGLGINWHYRRRDDRRQERREKREAEEFRLRMSRPPEKN